MGQVTLTFDNGPTPGITERVLEQLDRAGIRATFFVIGQKLMDRAGLELLRQIQRAGHWIGNHTLTHSLAFGDCPDAGYAQQEIDRTQELIGAYSHPTKLFRPYGRDGLIGPHLFSEAALTHLLAGGYTTVLWNSVPGDWRDPDGWVESGLADVQRLDRSVVVLHDIDGACLDHLPEFLTRLADTGVQICQDLPDLVVATRRGQTVNLLPDYVAGRT